MSNVLSAEKREQVVALGRLGWPLRRIEEATGVRRETASGYLKAAGIAVRPPGGWGPLAAGARPSRPRGRGSRQAKRRRRARRSTGCGSRHGSPDRGKRSDPARHCRPVRERATTGGVADRGRRGGSRQNPGRVLPHRPARLPARTDSTGAAPRKGRNRNEHSNIRKRCRAHRNTFSVHMAPLSDVRFPIDTERPPTALKNHL